MGYVFTARSVGYLFGSMLGGPLFDRFDGNKLLAVALVLTIVGTALIPVVSDIWLLAALVTLIGFACVSLPSTFLIAHLTHARTHARIAGWASSTREATSASSDFTVTTSGRTFKVAPIQQTHLLRSCVLTARLHVMRSWPHSAMHFSFGLGAFVAPMVVGWVIDVHDGDPSWYDHLTSPVPHPIPSSHPHQPSECAGLSGQ
jgi:MFS family permease